MLVDPPCKKSYDPEDMRCFDYTEGHKHRVDDERDNIIKVGAPCAYLPHSCDEWVIGGPVQVAQLIEDLQTALTTMMSQKSEEKKK